jgi:hypothetical protein
VKKKKRSKRERERDGSNTKERNQNKIREKMRKGPSVDRDCSFLPRDLNED